MISISWSENILKLLLSTAGAALCVVVRLLQHFGLFVQRLWQLSLIDNWNFREVFLWAGEGIFQFQNGNSRWPCLTGFYMSRWDRFAVSVSLVLFCSLCSDRLNVKTQLTAKFSTSDHISTYPLTVKHTALPPHSCTTVPYFMQDLYEKISDIYQRHISW